MKLSSITIAFVALASPILAKQYFAIGSFYTQGECTYDNEGAKGCWFNAAKTFRPHRIVICKSARWEVVQKCTMNEKCMELEGLGGPFCSYDRWYNLVPPGVTPKEGTKD